MAATGRPGLMPALLWTNGRFTVGLGAGTGVTKGEEPRSAPGRAGDGAGDRRQARIGRAQPVEAIAHHRDGVALALMLANEHRAGLEVTARWPGVAGKAVQERQAVAIKTPEGLFLDPHRDHAAQEFPPQTGRGFAAEYRSPAPPNRIRRKRADARDLGRNRGQVRHRLPRHDALG